MKVFQYGGSFNDHDQPAWMGDMVVRCARLGCSNTVTRDNSYSFVISFATRGPDGRIGAITCPDGDEIKAGHIHAQHFCCSPECAVQCAHACIDEHLVTTHQAQVATLAQHDAAEAEERAAFEEYQRQRAQQAQVADGSGYTPPQLADYHQAMQALAQGPQVALVAAPASTDVSTPSAEVNTDVAQLVQQPEAHDPADEQPRDAEPTPDDGPPTLHSMSVVSDASTPEPDTASVEAISDVAHDEPQPEPVDTPPAPDQGNAPAAEASVASTPDAAETSSESISDVTHEAEGESSHDAA